MTLTIGDVTRHNLSVFARIHGRCQKTVHNGPQRPTAEKDSRDSRGDETRASSDEDGGFSYWKNGE